MCIRYDLYSKEVIKWSKVLHAWIYETDWKEGLDLYPGYEAPIVIPVKGQPHTNEVRAAKWGISMQVMNEKGNLITKNVVNSRNDKLTSRTWSRLFRETRCILPVSGLYEQFEGRWLRFSHKDEPIIAVPGLYKPPALEGDLPTYTMLTNEPNKQFGRIHDRMPSILTTDEALLWLDPEAKLDDLIKLLTPFPEDDLIEEDRGSNKRPKPKTPDTDLT